MLARMLAATRSLRFRLMLWNAGVVAVTALLVLIGLREGVRRALIHELDAVLVEDLKEVQLILKAAPSPYDPTVKAELNRKAIGHKAHDWFVRYLDARDKALWSSKNSPDPLIPPEGPEGKPFGSLNYRLAYVRLPEPIRDVAGIRIGASTDMINEDVKRLDQVVGIAVTVVLVVAPLCGYWLADRSLRPVADIIDTAARLRPNRLDERLPNLHAGDELDRLAVTINGLLDRIAAHLRERRDFLANSAHELRSPLAAIRSTVEVALQSGRISPADEETMAVVIDQCTSLEHLVNQLLLIAETEAERLTVRREEVPLDKLVSNAADMFDAAAELKSVTLSVGPLPPTTVHGNRNHLRQVVNNLLDNAVKFTGEGGNVHVTLTRRDGSRTAALTVEDTGPGISPEDLPKVFDRFFRADRARQRVGRGTGLGLSICKAVVEAHGGTITVASTLGQGTTFTVTLPTVEPSSRATAEPGYAAAGA
jgi:signal transduction histidine kinase